MNSKLKIKRILSRVKISCLVLAILMYLPFLLIASIKNRFKNMRELVIDRISEMLIEMPDLQFEFDISIEDLRSMSNVQLLDLYEEIFTDQ